MLAAHGLGRRSWSACCTWTASPPRTPSATRTCSSWWPSAAWPRSAFRTPLRRAGPARGAGALELRALLRAQRRRRDRAAGRRRSRWAASAGRSPSSSATSGASPRWPSRMGARRHRPAPDRVLQRDGGDHLRARRHARQVHRRRDHGALGRAHRPRRRPRPGARAAAVAMQQAVDARLNERWAAAGRPEIGVGIGINYGEVFAGNIGSHRDGWSTP